MSYPNLDFWQAIYCWRSIVWGEGKGKGPGSPDFAMIAFADRTWNYFTDLLG